MADNFATHNPGLDSPAEDAFAITPHDTNDLAQVTRGIYVGGAGDLTVVTKGGTTVLFSAVPAGVVLPVRAAKVKSTGTAATSLVGLV